jgi:hypothetical protein
MRSILNIIIFLAVLLLTGCITQFTPETNEGQELIVVEGLITDQPGPDTIKLSKSIPLYKTRGKSPLKGCTVYITDENGKPYYFAELNGGIYITDPESFRAVAGGKYTLHILTNNATSNHYSYESLPAEMKPVPSIDSLYYEKVIISGPDGNKGPVEGCKIFIDTHDPENLCKFYRWDFTETWEFIIPYYVPNRICWITDRSDAINIKNTSVLAEDRINKYPLKYISNETDRLSRKYSMLVNQYSLTEEEYHYWEKLKNVTEDVGSLYDITPANIQGNINCIEDPSEKVLGYFSVSSVKSKRIFINDSFKGLVNLYTECVSDTIFGNGEIPYLNVLYWIIEDNPFARPPYRVLTMHKGCADCTVRGSTTEPSFWKEEK